MEALRSAQNYEANEQWDNAARLYAGLVSQLCADDGEAEEWDLTEALQTCLEHCCKRPLAHEALQVFPIREIDEAIKPFVERAREHFNLGAEAVRFWTSFPLHGWEAVVLFGDRDCTYADVDSSIVFPSGPCHPFLVKAVDGKKPVALVKRPHSALHQVLAHFARANLMCAQNLYSENRVILDTGYGFIEQTMGELRLAFLLDPDYAWALRCIGEALRNLANGWLVGGKTEEGEAPERTKLQYYVQSLIFFHRSLILDPESAWGKAHFGASICNIRGFVATKVRESGFPEELERLYDILLPPKGRQLDNRFIDLAIKHLREAQTLMGEYYPWAQAYEGIAYFIKSFLLKGSGNREDYIDEVRILAQRSTIYVIGGFYLQPGMIGETIEPGLIYGNSFISASQLASRVDDHETAWFYGVEALARSFGNPFIPGLGAFVALQHLVDISFHLIQQDGSQTCATAGIRRNPWYPVPETAIRDAQGLAKLIVGAFDETIQPMVVPFLQPCAKLETKVRIGLQATTIILWDFDYILTYLGQELVGKVDQKELQKISAANFRIRNFSLEIVYKINDRIIKDDGPRPSAMFFDQVGAYVRNYNHLFKYSLVNFGQIDHGGLSSWRDLILQIPLDAV